MGNQLSKRPNHSHRNSATLESLAVAQHGNTTHAPTSTSNNKHNSNVLSNPHSNNTLPGKSSKGSNGVHENNSSNSNGQGHQSSSASSSSRQSQDSRRGSWQNNNNNSVAAISRPSPTSETKSGAGGGATNMGATQQQKRDHTAKGDAGKSTTLSNNNNSRTTGTGSAPRTDANNKKGQTAGAGSLPTDQARHSLDTIAQGTNGGHYNANNQKSSNNTNLSTPHSQQQQQQQLSSAQPNQQQHLYNNSQILSNDTLSQSRPTSRPTSQQRQKQPSPPPPPLASSVPSIPFAVTTPGNPILVRKHGLAPLTITPSSNSSSYVNNRSPPPQLSPKSPGHPKSAEQLSPTSRLSFMGSTAIATDLSNHGNNNKGGKHMDLDDMISRLLDAGYSGKISKSICLKNSEILFICQMAREVFLSQPTLIELNAPVKIVGDIHGQYTDLLRLFEMCGFPPSANFLFLGDYVDRGRMSLETILLLFCYKIKYPENFFLLRGNHECANVTKVYGFYDECKRRASIKMWKAFVDVFNCLPLAAIVANKIFCVHGGLSPSLGSMDDIRALRRPTDVPDYGLLNDLLWSDPSDTALDWEDNERGVSYCFGRSIIQAFLNRHDFDLVCRAHMVVEDGYEFFNDRTLVTVFSAPNYCGEFDNFGAVMSVNEDLLCSFELLKPIDQATARAQMQSLAASAGGWRVNKQRLSIPDSNSLYASSMSATVHG